MLLLSASCGLLLASAAAPVVVVAVAMMLLLSASCDQNGGDAGWGWSYSHGGKALHFAGPDQWSRLPGSSRCGHGAPTERQAPVSITTSKAAYNPAFAALEFDYDWPSISGLTVVNDGVSLIAMLADSGAATNTHTDKATLSGGPFEAGARFVLREARFHWGSNAGSSGSEHAIDGQFAEAEVHLVHYSDRFASSIEAQASPRGLAVVAVFIRVGDAPNAAFDRLLGSSTIAALAEAGAAVSVPGVSLAEWLPASTEQYFHYPGSLTAPPCYESVRWVVMREPITISQEQLDRLRSVRTDPTISSNSRPLQPLNGRVVEASFNPNFA
ncbi:eukaryotic-type carbonic anhydrase [Capsaspora owczarzaki ATCC 30864]|uniref:carbonic anhydrase n=1 Tax=Capsaspora owczarzaki (strain ATCC 30864) TaxID=595528 RepID=A0A0D2X032_CAPO3|nr:eukaryotic-type carbonic anhydrase [Capsaspora owczarzaki ATCC 30864]